MPRESKKDRSARAANLVFDLLRERYPDARCALDHENAYQLIVATILSAQCTDARVNVVTPALFGRFPNVSALAEASTDELENLIRSTGFYRSKTKNLIGMAHAVMERHEGEIPRVLGDLVKLPGVGRKTANVVLGNALRDRRGSGGGYPRRAARSTTPTQRRSRPCEGGTRPDRPLSARPLDPPLASAHLPRQVHLSGPATPVRDLSGVVPLPLRLLARQGP